MDERLLNDQLRYTSLNEGYSDKPYLDTADPPKLTVGIGYNISAHGIPAEWIPYIKDQLINIKFPKELLENKFKTEIMFFIYTLSDKFTWFDNLSKERKMVIVDMCFNLGLNGLMNFKDMIAAIQANDFDRASKEILDSKYAKKDVKKRAICNAEIMRTNDAATILNNLN